MATLSHTMPARSAPAESRTGEEAEWRFYFAVIYPACLVAALARRLARRAPGPAAYGSIFREASAAARGVIPWIFRG